MNSLNKQKIALDIYDVLKQLGVDAKKWEAAALREKE